MNWQFLHTQPHHDGLLLSLLPPYMQLLPYHHPLEKFSTHVIFRLLSFCYSCDEVFSKLVHISKSTNPSLGVDSYKLLTNRSDVPSQSAKPLPGSLPHFVIIAVKFYNRCDPPLLGESVLRLTVSLASSPCQQCSLSAALVDVQIYSSFL